MKTNHFIIKNCLVGGAAGACLFAGLMIFNACNRSPIPEGDSQSTKVSETQSVPLGKEIQNAYTLENMQKAIDTINKELEAMGETTLSKEWKATLSQISVTPTDLYVRFLPKNEEECRLLAKDSTLLLFTYPLDREPPEGSMSYHDPSIPADKPTWRYAVVDTDYEFPNVQYEVIEKVFIPEHHPLYKARAEGQTLSWEDQQTDNKLIAIENMALYLTGNLPKRETAALEQRKVAYQKSIREVKIPFERDRQVCVWFVCWDVPDDWWPAGRITMQDEKLGQVGIEGVRVRIQRGLMTDQTITKADGSFRFGAARQHMVNYSVVWYRYEFEVRDTDFEVAATGGPFHKGDWNLNLADPWGKYLATIFRAGFHYCYGDIKGLERPPKNDWYKNNIRLLALRRDVGSRLGEFMAGRQWLGAGAAIHISAYKYINGSPDIVYGTVIHELAHAAHWKFDSGSYNADDRLAESWARGAQWALTTMKYGGYKPSYGGGRNSNDPKFNNYTGLVQDLIDSRTSTADVDDGTEHTATGTDDEVSGYSVKQLEEAIRGSRNWNDWKNNLKNKYYNATENKLDKLFAYWNH